jgi:hypothetical protein
MYVRGAKKREEVWLLDRLDEFGLADPAFRSRDYVVALDEESGSKAGFGRIRSDWSNWPVTRGSRRCTRSPRPGAT